MITLQIVPLSIVAMRLLGNEQRPLGFPVQIRKIGNMHINIKYNKYCIPLKDIKLFL